MEHNLNQTRLPPAPNSMDHESGGEIPRLPLSSISIDGGTQVRAELHHDVIDEYAAAIEEGVTFPPIVIFYDGDRHWLADGFHRYHAAVKAGRTDIDVDVRQGGSRDAILHSVGANAEHGLRRSKDDKRCAVHTLLSDPEWSAWSDREIGRRCRVSGPFVAKQRGLTANVCSQTERRYTTRHGTATTMRTANIGPMSARSVKGLINPEFRNDTEFQAEADAAARDLEIERDERIAMSGASELADENENLRKQNAKLVRRIAALLEENGSLKARADVWKRRAVAAGWRAPANA